MNNIGTTADTAVATQTITSDSLSHAVKDSVQRYFIQLDGQEPVDLYPLVLTEMEIPLLKCVLKATNWNQSKTAKVLGISRGTLRKKMIAYKII